MNELQIRISADIAALQAALTKAKNSIKSFEESTEKESEKSNVGFRRKIGLIESLTNKSKALRTALSQATNEKDVERYNQELEKTIQEMTRLNALGRTLGNASTGAAGGINKLAASQVNANGVAIEFNRIIQDAPFGLIGIGNNIQQLTANFAQVSKSAGGAGAAIKASLSSLISPANLLVLAVSAVTAGFTAYQMGAFDGLLATKDFGEELDKFRESLSDVDSARFESIKTSDQEIFKLNSLRSIIEDETVSRNKRLLAIKELRDQFPTIAKNLSDEALLAGQVGKAYEEVTKQLIARAEVESSVKRIVDLNDQERLILEQNKDSLDEIIAVRERIAALQDKANAQAEIIAKSQDVTEKDLALLRKLGAENTIRFLRNENEAVDQLLKIEEQRINLTNIANNALKETLVNTEEVTTSNQKNNETIETQVEKLGLISGLTEQIKDLNDQKDLAKDQQEINLITDKINLLKDQLDAIKKIAEEESRLKSIVRAGPIDTSRLPKRDGSVAVTNPALEAPKQELGIIQQLQEQIKSINALRDATTDPTRIQAYNEQLKVLQDQLAVYTGSKDSIVDANQIIIDSFGALGTQVANSLGIANNGLRAFVSTVLSNIPKVIQAISALSQAKKAKAKADLAADQTSALGGGVVLGVEAAKGLGPLGLALLPLFIGGALALISGAFSKIGGSKGGVSGGGGGGGIPGGGGVPRTFTNAQASLPNSFNPDLAGFGSGLNASGGKLTAEISGDSLIFVLERAQEKKNRS